MSEETPQMRGAREGAEKRSNASAEVVDGWPHHDGKPMVKISCAAAELIPTVQYGNATVGPVQVTCFVTADGELAFDADAVAKAITAVQERCEAAVAEERQTLHALLRSNAGSAQRA